MPQIRSAILFSGTESPREFAQKLMDLQRQSDARFAEIEKTQKDIEERLSEIE